MIQLQCRNAKDNGDVVTYCIDKYECVVDADALLVVTEWKEFRIPSWDILNKVMNTPLIIDGRNIYDKQEMKEYGFQYYSIG